MQDAPVKTLSTHGPSSTRLTGSVDRPGKRQRRPRGGRGKPAGAHRPLGRILLVDDDPDVHEIVRTVLERVAGFSVCVCPFAPAAAETALSFAPDLILLDVMMPRMDGVQVLQALRGHERTAGIPVVFLTARPRLGEPWEEADVLGVISKPFEPLDLPRLLREMWERRG